MAEQKCVASGVLALVFENRLSNVVINLAGWRLLEADRGGQWY